MGSLWRSQEMSMAQLYLQSDAAYECVSALGELGLVQFRDLNPDVNAFQRKFVNEVRRCDEMERRLRFFESEINTASVMLLEDNPTQIAAPTSSEMQEMEREFERLERELKEINTNEGTLKKQELELCELREILRKSSQFFDGAEMGSGAQGDGAERAPLLDPRSGDRGHLGFVTGVIFRDRVSSFERILWRACRGNVFMRQVEIEDDLVDPVSGDALQKNVFVVFFQGDQLEARVRKICEGFDATIYPCPNNPVQRRELEIGVQTRIDDLHRVLERTSDHRRQALGKIATTLRSWMVMVKKIKGIYHQLNKFEFDNNRKCLLAECWCPTARLGDIREALRHGSERSGSSVPPILNPIETTETPPTYHVTDKFTSGFQNIVDAYGVASYREVNPGPFTIITFPFLFAVMFGDCGHGLIMFVAAFLLVKYEDRLKSFRGGGEIWDTMFGGRYIILLMGMFSIYTGFFYNECFAKALTLGSSGWKLPGWEDVKEVEEFDLIPYGSDRDFSFAYPFGVDPVWQNAENKLTFTNSFKMKLSVVLGISQMTFGVVLSSFNHRFFKNKLGMYFEFIPQLLFLSCIFGYLVIMIIYKWLSSSFPNVYGNPPSLLLMLINMFLKFGSIDPKEVLYGDSKGNVQKYLQMILVFTAVLCVPLMLFVKPCVLKARNKRRNRAPTLQRVRITEYTRGTQGSINSEDDVALLHHEEIAAPEQEPEPVAAHGGGHGHGEEFDFGEIMVHQAIHTIEFCLGCISNTASYLRLWALSLAHGQLSEVLWEMVLRKGFAQPYLLYPAFAVWAVLTVAVLLIMEGLSSFLHALRLHWVEFNNKFYEGQGFLFSPFSFEAILDGTEDSS